MRRSLYLALQFWEMALGPASYERLDSIALASGVIEGFRMELHLNALAPFSFPFLLSLNPLRVCASYVTGVFPFIIHGGMLVYVYVS